MACYHTTDYAYGNVIYQLRAIQIYAMLTQILFVVFEYKSVGLFYIAVLTSIVLFNLYIVGSRWYYAIDGRYDFQQLIRDSNIRRKVQYAFELFGGLVFALIAHFVSPTIQSRVSLFFYNTADYFSISTALVCSAVEIYEGYQTIKC